MRSVNAVQVSGAWLSVSVSECECVCVGWVVVVVVVVVGWGSEFSDSWGKRGEGGQGREGVQLPDSLVDEAVFQSVGPGLETPQSPP